MLTKESPIWKFVSHLFLSIDQFGNALAGGNSDNTISARIGFYNYHAPSEEVLWYWKCLRWIIDKTFEPVDGKAHCHEAYHNDAGEVFDTTVIKFFIVIAGLIIIITCIPIAAILYTLGALKIVKQKVIDREENLMDRFDYCNLQLKSILQELKEHTDTNLNEEDMRMSFERFKNRSDYLISVIESGTMRSKI